MYRCFGNLNSFGFVLFFFSSGGLFAAPKAGLSWFQINNHLCYDGSALGGLQYGAAVSVPVPCFCRDSEQSMAALLCQTTQRL